MVLFSATIAQEHSGVSSSATSPPPYDESPRMVGGVKALRKATKYPQNAIRLALEETVIVKTFIDSTGHARGSRILLGHTELNSAAIKAVESVKWLPGKKDGKPISVWIDVPIKFKPSWRQKRSSMWGIENSTKNAEPSTKSSKDEATK